MIIIKQGLVFPKNGNYKKNIRQFECERCNCIFKADEYEWEFDDSWLQAWCRCPNCGLQVWEKSTPSILKELNTSTLPIKS